MIKFRTKRGVMDAFSVFHGRTDEEWLALLQRSVKEDVIDGVRFPRFPAEALQTQFVGSANSQALQEARWFYEELKRQAVSAGASISEHSKILDFGCGWGRYIRFFWKDVREEGLFGVDVDPDILSVCRDTGVPGQLSRIYPTGTLPFKEAFFSNVMSYSVFTHLPETVHLHWVTEIARVMRPGSTFTLTLEPRRFLDFVAEQGEKSSLSEWHKGMAQYSGSVSEFLKSFDAGQLVYLPTGGGNYRDASTYGDAAVPLSFIEKHWTRYFEILDYIDDPQRFWQAVLVVRRR